MADQPKLAYSTVEAARLLSISRRSVLKLIREGKLRGIRFAPKKWLVPSDEVQKFLSA